MERRGRQGAEAYVIIRVCQLAALYTTANVLT